MDVFAMGEEVLLVAHAAIGKGALPGEIAESMRKAALDEH